MLSRILAFAILLVLTAARPGASLPKEATSGEAFAIATLASPRRCLHIAAPDPPPADGAATPSVCTDFPDWFDGTNGCQAYRRNADYCAKYGSLDYAPHASVTPNAACCACGGGRRVPPSLRIGDYVRLRGVGPHDECQALQVVEVAADADPFYYLVEVRKPCGPMQMTRSPNGVHRYREMFQVGHRAKVFFDDPAVIARRDRVELRKCRTGQREQEFVRADTDEERGNATAVLIQHKLTGRELAPAAGAIDGFVNVTQVFDEGLFEGSGDFFFLTVTTEERQRTVKNGQREVAPSSSFLASGMFGEKEYSEVALVPTARNDFVEQEFSMWQFRAVAGEGPDDGAASEAADDEHFDWLLRTTRSIGIDYLDRLPPWHLLDVEREASKKDVKARFRELSRSFHPDKLVNAPEKKELYERIFLLLQNAYQGLKSANEAEREEFRVRAESSSQLFAHSQYVVELLPFHWTKIEKGDEDEGDAEGTSGSDRYILNVASHLNTTLLDDGTQQEETGESPVQLWVTFMYSARCGMSKTVVGMIDLAARHLELHENIKVGAYGCGLHKEHPIPPEANDPTGVQSDPICAQFERRETPNVHLIVETLPGRRRDGDVLVEMPPSAELVEDNARFKYFYAAVANGNTTHFYPHNFIDFAKKGKAVWANNHLVHKMTSSDFEDQAFIGNVSLVAYLDGTGNGDTDSEIVSAIVNSLPGVAQRFQADDVYVGIAHCGHGDEDTESQKQVDCSELDVSWLPDIKIYGVNDTQGISLLRGHFGDTRDVQIALESTGNVLRMMLGGTDDEFEDEFEELEEDENEEGGGSCNMQQPPPPPEHDLDEIDGRMENTLLLEADTKDAASETKPALENESKPAIDRGNDKKVPKKPKLASTDDKPQLSEGRARTVTDKVSGFHQRESRRVGGGKVLGSGSSGSTGLIA